MPPATKNTKAITPSAIPASAPADRPPWSSSINLDLKSVDVDGCDKKVSLRLVWVRSSEPVEISDSEVEIAGVGSGELVEISDPEAEIVGVATGLTEVDEVKEEDTVDILKVITEVRTEVAPPGFLNS